MRHICLLLLCLLFFVPYVQAQERYHRVQVTTGADGLSKMAAAGIAVDHGEYKKGQTFTSDLSDSELADVIGLGLPYTILIDDVAAFYARRNNKAEAERPTSPEGCKDCETYATPANFQLGSMGGFFTYEEMLDILDSMKSKYPDLVTLKQPLTAALTGQGRPVYYVKISDNATANEPEPQVLYTALHHAREPQSLSQLIFYMWYLLENYNSAPGIKNLVDNTELYFIPCVNPDGYVYNETTNPAGGGLWRKNRRNNGSSFGVDINRNYGAFWGIDDQGSSPNGNSETFRGTAAFSEPETQMIRDFCNAHEFKIALNAHTFSNLLIYPWGHIASLQTPDSNLFHHFAADMTECSGFLSGTGDQTVGYLTNGDSDDWMYGEQGTKSKIYSMTPEAGAASDGFWPAANRIVPIAKQTMDQNLDAAKLATAYAEISNTSPFLMNSTNGYVRFTLKRTGLEPGNFTVSLTPLSANIAAAGAPKNINNPAHLVDYQDSISISLNGTANTNNVVQYLITWTNQTGYSEVDTFTRYYGQTDLAFYSDGNSLDSFTTTGWGLTAAQSVSTPASITDSPDGNYQDNANSSITTKGDIDLTNAQAAYVDFFAKWDIEKNFDYVEFMVSENNSAYVPLCGRYNHKGNEVQNGSRAVYDGRQADWIKETINLSDYAGKLVKLRFTLHSDGGLTKDGFYFDEFSVHRIRNSVVGINPLATQDIALMNSPNPCSTQTSIHYELPATKEHYFLEVTNQLGSVLHRQAVSNTANQTNINVSSWNNGIYYYKIVSDTARTSTKKMVVVH